MSEKLYEVGKIVNTHGIRGELKVISVTDFPEKRFCKGSKLVLVPPSAANQPSAPGKVAQEVVVEAARLHKNTYIVKFEELNNINEVEKFKGGVLKVAESDRLELEENEFYYDEIIGCSVWTDEGVELGHIDEILTTGANDVWVVKEEKSGRKILLPFIDDCIIEVDMDHRRVKVHLLEGLVE